MKANTTLTKTMFGLLVAVMLLAMLPVAAFAATPAAPGNLQATAVADGDLVTAGNQLGVTLTWADNSLNELGFRVMRAVAPNATFTDLTGLGLPPGTVSYTDTTVTAGVTYTYQIVAFNNDPTPPANSASSGAVAITASVPAAPTLLTATQQAGPPQSVTLSWTDNAADEVGFKIERADNAGFTQNLVQNVRVANAVAGAVTFVDSEIIPGATYFYRVSALGASGASAAAALAAPGSITVTAAAGMDAGPVVPIPGFPTPNGFPLYYQDTLGNKVRLLPLGGVLLGDPPIVGNAYSQALGFASEEFYWLAAVEGLDTGTGTIVLIEFAMEAVFGSPTGDATPSTEAVMARTRIRFDVPVNGDYTVQTPYGTREFLGVVAGVAGFDVNMTEDIGVVPQVFEGPNSPIQPQNPLLNPFPITVFLKPVTPPLDPDLYGDGLTPTLVTGGAGGTAVTITGPGVNTTSSTWLIAGRNLAPAVVPSFTRAATTATSFTFTDTTAGTPTSWTWNFGDGTPTSALPNPTHTYASPGNYIVTLTAGNTGGAATTSQMLSIFGAPSATFTTAAVAPQQQAPPFTINFTSPTVGNPTGWAWSFGDGATSTAQNPSHTYATSGDFTVTLDVFNPAGSASGSQPLTVGPPSAPSAVTGVVAGTAANPQINLSWTDNSASEAGFRIERATGAAGTPGTFAQIAEVAANVTNFTDTTGITTNTIFFYHVLAFTASSASLASNVAQVTVGNVPAGPTNFTVTLLSATSVRLDWADNANNEDLYHIHKAPTAAFAPAQIIHTIVPANIITLTDTVALGETWFYFVHGMNALGEGPDSATVSVSVAAPAAPSGLSAALASTTSVALAWTDASNNESGFKIERSTDNGVTFTQLGTAAANAIAFTDVTVPANSTPSYRVIATNVVGDSAASNPAQVNLAAPTQPVLQATANAAGTIAVTMTSNNASTFAVQRSTGATFVAAGATAAVAVTPGQAYTDSAAAPATQYTYQVTATNVFGQAVNTVTVTSATPLAFPQQPSLLTATAAGPARVDLTWTDGSTNEAGFRVLRNPNATGQAAFGQVGADLGVNATAFTDTTTVRNTAYQYQVVAFNSIGASNPATFSVSTPNILPPPAASGLTAQLVGGVQINLTWTDNSVPTSPDKATEFVIKRAVGGGAFTTLATVATTSFSDTNLQLGATHQYQVIASNLGGPAAAAVSAQITTAASQPPAGGTGGGGGTVSQPVTPTTPSAPPPVTIEIGIMGKAALATIDTTGVFLATGTFTSADGKVMLVIDKDTKALMADGSPLNGVNIQAVAAPAAPQGKAAVGAALNMGPNGATFEPAAPLAMTYDPADMPAGAVEAGLKIGFWDGAAWTIMASQVDTGSHTITAAIPHFGVHAVLAGVEAAAEPVEPTPEPTPTAQPGPTGEPEAEPAHLDQKEIEVELHAEDTIDRDNAFGKDGQGNELSTSGDLVKISTSGEGKTVITLPVALPPGATLKSFDDPMSGTTLLDDKLTKEVKDATGQKVMEIEIEIEKTEGTGVTALVTARSMALKTMEQQQDLSAADPTVGTVAANVQVELKSLLDGAGVKVTVEKQADAQTQTSFQLAASRSGKELKDVAFVMNVQKTALENVIHLGAATITMKVASAWVEAHGGADNVKIVRVAESGESEVLETSLLGVDDSGHHFAAISPNGLSAFGLAAIAAPAQIEPTPTPTPEPTATPVAQPTPAPTATPVPQQPTPTAVPVQPTPTAVPVQPTQTAVPQPTPGAAIVPVAPMAGAVTQVIEPARKATLQLPDQTRIDIPANALPVLVQMQARVASLQEIPAPPTGKVVKALDINLFNAQAAPLGPTTFAAPVVVEVPLSAEDMQLIGDDPANAEVLYFDAATGQWEELHSTLDLGARLIRAEVTHMSLFAVVVPSPVTAGSPWWYLVAILGALIVLAAAGLLLRKQMARK